jgi:hypothetical protein
MKATAHNSHFRIIPHDVVEWCQRCHMEKPQDVAVAFQRDGTATFRFLCVKCERMERSLNQPRLFGKDTPMLTFADPDEAIEAVEEPEPVEYESPQLSLFGGAFTF